MFENDYIMRLIHEMIRALLKLIFGIDTKGTKEFISDYEEENEEFHKLKSLIDKGQINEAENQLFALSEEKSNENLKLGILFYAYLNEKSDTALGECNFSRDEVLYGIKRIADMYGFGSIVDSFIDEER